LKTDGEKCGSNRPTKAELASVRVQQEKD